MKTKNKFTIVTTILLTIGFGLLSLPVKDPVIKVASESLHKTVSIRVEGVIPVSLFDMLLTTQPIAVGGAGVYITPEGHILTCAHLFDMPVIETILIGTYDGETSSATLLYKDDDRDLALLATDPGFPVEYARLGDPRTLEVGQPVVAIGNPLGLNFTVTHGIISALNRDNMGIYNMIQSDAFLNPGNSGGPLFDLEGSLIGINSRIRPPVRAPIFTGLGFAVDPTQIIEFLAKFQGLERVF